MYSFFDVAVVSAICILVTIIVLVIVIALMAYSNAKYVAAIFAFFDKMKEEAAALIAKAKAEVAMVETEAKKI